MTASTTSVVICAYTRARADYLLDAITSLRDQTLRPAEIVVVIDHNRELLEFVRGRARDVVAVANREAPGLAGARNTGVEATHGEVVAFLDDDAVAAPNWIERLCAAYDDPRVLAVGGAVLPLFERGRPRWLPEEFNWVVGCSYRGMPVDRSPVRNLIGCNMSFRREALEETGGFAGGLGRVGADRFGCEETDLCIRIGQRWPDRVILYAPGAQVSHRVTPERTTLGYFLSRCRAEGLSKAEVARRSGRRRGLESERAYTRHALPVGVREGLAAFAHGEGAGLVRAGAILLGLAATANGFAAGSKTGMR
jgi:GT2 family glycosyltransferase